MVARIPLIVNSSVNQIQELPSGDTLDVEGLNSLTLTAFGTIPANAPVVLTSAGRAKTISSVAYSEGSASTFYTSNGGTAHIINSTWDTSQNAFVVSYIESGGGITPKLRAGTVSGTSVTYGTQVDLNSEPATRNPYVISNKNGGGIVTYDDNNDLYLKTFNLSGSTITVGNQVTIKSGSSSRSANPNHTCYLGEDGGSHYFACAYNWTGSGQGNYSRIIKYDGQNNTTLGTETTFESTYDTPKPIRCVAISSTQFVIFWSANENKIFGIVGTRNGTNVTYGSKLTLYSQTPNGGNPTIQHFDACYDPLNDKVIIAYDDQDTTSGKVIICTVSDSPNTTTNNVLTMTTPIQFHNSTMGSLSVRATSIGRILIIFRDTSASNVGYHNYGTYNLDKTTLTFAGKVATLGGVVADHIEMANMDNGKILVAYEQQVSGSDLSKTIVRQEEHTDLNGDSFLGFSVGAYNDLDTARISVSGSTTTQSGLRIGKKYYVQNNGTIGTNTGTFGVLAGKAISETQLLITSSTGSATYLPGNGANGSNTQLQFNDDGALAGANLKYNSVHLDGSLDFSNSAGTVNGRIGCYHSSIEVGGSPGDNNLYFYGGVTAGSTYALKVSGNTVHVNGTLSKTTGTFRIPHPLVDLSTTKDLVPSFIEGPQCDNIYRGKIDLVGGTATVNLDTKSNMTAGTFVALNRDIQCFTTNETGWTNVKGSVSGNILTITAQDDSCTDTISWMVVGERQDNSIKSSDLTDANGKLIMEPNQSIPPAL